MANGGTTNGFDFSRSRSMVRVYSHHTFGKSKSFSNSAAGRDEEMKQKSLVYPLRWPSSTPKTRCVTKWISSANILYPGHIISFYNYILYVLKFKDRFVNYFRWCRSHQWMTGGVVRIPESSIDALCWVAAHVIDKTEQFWDVDPWGNDSI